MDLVSQYLEKKYYFISNEYQSYELRAVESNYYEFELCQRKRILNAPHESYLCKTIIMENKSFDPQYEGKCIKLDKYYKRYYCII